MRRVMLYGLGTMVGLGLAWIFRSTSGAAFAAWFCAFLVFHIAYRLLSGRWRY